MKLTKLSPKTQNLIGCGVLFALLSVGILGYGIYSIYSFLNRVSEYSNKEIPAELLEPKVFKGDNFLKKSEIYKLKELTYSEIIAKSVGIKDEKERQKLIDSESAKNIYGYSDIKVCGDEIVAVGRFGGQFFDKNGNFKRDIYFEPSESEIKVLWWKQKHYRATLDNLKIVDIENDGRCEFVSDNSIDGFSLFDNQGNLIWRYGNQDFDPWKKKSEAERDQEIYITEAVVLDLNNDGFSEFIISQKNDGIRTFDTNKKEIWFQPDEFPTGDFRLVDVDGKGETELLEFQGMSSAIRDKQTGNVLKKVEIDGWRKDILVFKTRENKQVSQLFDINNKKLTLYDFSNKKLMETEAPLSEIEIPRKSANFPPPTPIYVGNNIMAAPSELETDNKESISPKAVWVSLRKDKPKYLAIVGSFITFPRSNFYLYDEQGVLIYHELLSEDAETIAVIPAANENEEIIIGGKNTIWRYALN